MSIKNWTKGIRAKRIRLLTWWQYHGRIRAFITSTLFGIVFFLFSFLLQRDVTYLWMIAATGFCLFALAWATWKTPGHGDSIAHPILAIFVGMLPLAAYRWSFVFLGRPDWMFDGFTFSLFIGFSGFVLGGMLCYLRVIGHMQNQSPKFKIAFYVILIVSLILSLGAR